MEKNGFYYKFSDLMFIAHKITIKISLKNYRALFLLLTAFIAADKSLRSSY